MFWLFANVDVVVIIGNTVFVGTASFERVSNFEMSQALHDYFTDVGGGEPSLPVEEDNWYDDEDDESLFTLGINPHLIIVTDGSLIDGENDAIEEECTPSFKKQYATIIKLVIAMVDKFFARSMCSGIHVVAHHPILAIAALMQVLRRISPSIGDNLKIDSSNIKNIPRSKRCRTTTQEGVHASANSSRDRWSLASCNYFSCMEGMFSPMIMPNDAYEESRNTTCYAASYPKGK